MSTGPVVTTEGERLRSVDLLRTVAIAGALAVHLISAGFGFNDHPAVQRVWLAFAHSGSYGVSVFFVVSGFLIARGIFHRSASGEFTLRDFYVRRVGRILPLAALVLAIGATGVLLSGPSPARDFVFKEVGSTYDGWFFLSLPTFTFNWVRVFDQPSFGMHWDVWWSLAIEEQFYLIFPLLVILLGVRKQLVRVLLAIVVGGLVYRSITSIIAPDDFFLCFVSSFGAFDLLAMGVLLAYWRHRGHEPRRTLAIVMTIGGALLLAVVWSQTDLSLGPDRAYGPTLVGIGAVLFIHGSLALPSLQRRIPRVITFPGQLSYGMYLLHGLALFILWDELAVRRTLLAFPIFFLGTVALAAVAYYLFEAPMNSAIRTRFARRPAAVDRATETAEVSRQW